MYSSASQEVIDAVLPRSAARPPMTFARNHSGFPLLVFRDQVPLTWFISLGGLVFLALDRLSLAALPSLPHWAAPATAAAALAFFPTRAVLTHFGLLTNHKLRRVIPGGCRAAVPRPPSSSPRDETDITAPEFVILNLQIRVNSALGIFDPAFRHIGAAFMAMRDELTADPDATGLLNLECWLGTHRATANTVRNVFYFRDEDALRAFTRGRLHKGAWADYHRNLSRFTQLELSHEMFLVKEKGCEALYANCEPTGLAELWTRDKADDGAWVPTLKAVGTTPGVKDATSRDRMHGAA